MIIMPRWTKDEIKKLEEDYQKDKDILQKIFDRSWVSIRAKINRLDLKRQDWYKDDEEKLKKIYPQANWEKILKEFPNKTQKAIKEKARRLNVHRKNDNESWTQKEKDILNKYYATANKNKLTKSLPRRSWEAISNKAQKMGIKRQVNWYLEISKEKLHELYFVKNYNIKKCKEYFGCSNTPILFRLTQWFPKEFKEKLKVIGFKYRLADIKKIVENSGYKILKIKEINGFVRTKDYMKVTCPNQSHEPYNVKISSFLNGKRCHKCYFEMNIGKNNPAYNPNLTDKERESYRFVQGYKYWRRNVFERDNYTCQICGDNSGGNLQAHHLNSYDQNKNKRTNINNGITLCKSCHQKFHSEYGYGGNTKEHFETFKDKYHVEGVVIDG
jgi:hypothetical protein